MVVAGWVLSRTAEENATRKCRLKRLKPRVLHVQTWFRAARRFAVRFEPVCECGENPLFKMSISDFFKSETFLENRSYELQVHV